MTEVEWLACDDVRKLLAWFEWGTCPARKWQLFALACIEPIRPRLRDDRLLAALVAVARAAESECTAQELERAWDGARAAHDEIWEDASEQRWFYVQERAARAVVLATQPDHRESVPEVAARCVDLFGLCAEEGGALVRRHANQRHVALVHEIFGNPFRPVSLDPSWLTTDVLALARGIYDELAFDRTPILADALQDAGCDNDDVLNHCRNANQTHVRGCWVIDLLTGRG
jgi:hypothetical protein